MNSVLLRQLIVLGSLALFASAVIGCTSQGQIEDLAAGAARPIAYKIFIDQNELEISEGSSAILSIQLSDRMPTDTLVHLSLTGPTSFVQPVPAVITIPAGSLAIPLKIKSIDDSVFSGTQIIQLLMTTDNPELIVEPTSFRIVITDNEVPTVAFLLSTQTVSESSGTVTVTAQANGVLSSAVSIPLSFSGTAISGLGNDFEATSAVLTIPAGSQQGAVSITIYDDLISESDETVIVTMNTPSNATLGAQSVYTLTITDNDLGAFNITGITGVGDAILDAYLVNGVVPTVNFGASAGASSYDVLIYESDGSTIACPTANTASTTYSFTGCNLVAGLDYKVQVTANKPGVIQPAANNLIVFRVDRSPIANNDGAVRIMKNSAAITLDVLSAADSATRGTVADSDPDVGDTISITGITAGSSGGAISNTATNVTYTVPNSTFTGVETFTYTITDNHGATATGTVTIHVMDTYTWTGKVSSNWNVNGNWCGTITNNQCNGTTGYPNSSTTTSHVAVFDGTCSGAGHSCTASINTASSAYNLKLNSGYAGTLTQTAGQSLTLGAGGYYQNSGNFIGSTGTLNVAGVFSQTGGVFTGSTGTLNLNRDYSSTTITIFNIGASATFTAPLLLSLSAPNSTCGNLVLTFDVPTTLSLNNLTVSVPHSGGCTSGSLQTAAGDTITVLGNLNHWDGVLNGTWNLEGNLSIGSAADGGYGSITMNGAGNQTYAATSPGVSTRLYINKATGTVTDAGGAGYFSTRGLSLFQGSFTSPANQLRIDAIDLGAIASTYNVLYVGAGTTFTPPQLFTLTSGAVCQGQTLTFDVPTNLSLNDLTIDIPYGGCTQIIAQTGTGDTVTVLGTFTHSRGYLNGSWNLQGNLVVGSGGGGGGGTITMSGTANQTYQGNSPGITSRLAINKTSGTVTEAGSTGYLGVQGFSLLQGSFNSPATTFKLDALNFGATTTVYTVFSVASGTSFVAPQLLSLIETGASCQNFTLVFDVPTSLSLNDLSLNVAHSGCVSSLIQTAAGDTITVLGNFTHSDAMLAGNWKIEGNLVLGAASDQGAANLTFSGAGGQSINVAAGGQMPSGTITVNKPGGILTLLSNVSINATGQNLNVISGPIDMAGKNLTTKGLSLAGNTLTKNSGVLTVNSTVVGTGALYGGTVDP